MKLEIHSGLLVATWMAVCGCGGHSQFAVRPPVLKADDDNPFFRVPEVDDESDIANTVDVMLWGPVSRGLLFQPDCEAKNVNSLDEVPDSAWFTNRIATPEEIARGPCSDRAVPPFSIKSSKIGGTTPGFIVVDSRQQKYLLKIDEVLPWQPEISTAADAIVSRLYHAVGFNAPCNEVAYYTMNDLKLLPSAFEMPMTGFKIPLDQARLEYVLRPATRGPNGTIRFSTSRFIDGEPIGVWRTEGTRKDDPNDKIPHQDRRELRGEYFLAAWLAHWDSRDLNTFDTFVRPLGQKTGHVVHYFLDFSESLGGVPMRSPYQETRTGYETVSDFPAIGEDFFAFGIPRRPWDEVSQDPDARNLGYFSYEHFDPMKFAPQTPLLRWSRADDRDLAWMARKLARLDIRHIEAAVHAGKLSNPAEERKLVEILVQRRERILRVSFQKISPLADVVLDRDRLCALDLGITTKISNAESVEYTPGTVRSGARVCLPVPRTQGYFTLDFARKDSGRITVLRAHLFGSEKGRVLAGLERL